MQEKQVTIGTVTHKLPAPFIVRATQNPVEQEGTYPLPEAQLDRFMFKMSVVTQTVLMKTRFSLVVSHVVRTLLMSMLSPTLSVLSLCNRLVKTSTSIQPSCHMVEVVARTREDPRVLVGSSPRGSQALLKTARAAATMRGRDFVTPDDVKSIEPLQLRTESFSSLSIKSRS